MAGGVRLPTTRMRGRANPALARRAARLKLLADMAGGLLVADEPDDVLRPFVTAAKDLLGLDICFSYVADDATRRLRLGWVHGVSDRLARELNAIDYGNRLCGVVAETRKRLVLDHVQLTTEPQLKAARDAGLRAYAGFPLIGAAASFWACWASAAAGGRASTPRICTCWRRWRPIWPWCGKGCASPPTSAPVRPGPAPCSSRRRWGSCWSAWMAAGNG
ncbi:GAF domain-containing protein [Aerophototrophica crusticola]|uniref:GAF domain-containing protein n=1 Tax=Aerophototrophica crusticola TaxID=1709002 RepID=UPI00384B3165